MSLLSPTLGEAKQQVEKAAQRPETRGLARWGLLSKGALYVMVGLIAADVAIGGGKRVQDRPGALSATADSWPGKLLIAAVAVGLLGYAIWRLVESVLGRPLEGGESLGWPKRGGYLALSLWYLGLFGIAISALVGADQSSGSGREDRFTARVLEVPLGRWIVAGVGLGLLGAGGFNLWRGVTLRFRERMKTRKMSEVEERVFNFVGVVGHVARGIVFGLIGFFLVRAAWQYDPEEAIGLDGALAKVLRADYGSALLALVSGGLIAYGVYCFAAARYRAV
jgi:Domain of Unknown Function (DUF1206)